MLTAGLVGLGVALVLVAFLSVTQGSRAIGLSRGAAGAGRPGRRGHDQRHRHRRAAGAAHAARHPRRRRPRRRRRHPAGRHPQPAGRRRDHGHQLRVRRRSWSSPSPSSAYAASASTSGSPSPARSRRIVLVYAVASLGREGATPVKLALSGAAVTAGLGSVTTGIVLTHIDALNELRFWQVGSLAGRYTPILTGVAPFLAVGLVASLAFGRVLNGLALGEDTARGLGQRVAAHPDRGVRRGRRPRRRGHGRLRADRLRRAGGAARRPASSAVLTTGGSSRTRMLLAPLLLLLADVLGRVLGAPGELQVGVVLAVARRADVRRDRPLRPAVGDLSRWPPPRCRLPSPPGPDGDRRRAPGRTRSPGRTRHRSHRRAAGRRRRSVRAHHDAGQLPADGRRGDRVGARAA